MVMRVMPVQLKMVDRTNFKNCNAMKKIFTKLMLLAVAAAALVSCDKNFEEQTFGGELTQTVTLSAEKPAEVRTQLIEGVPYWSAGDKIGVYTTEKNLESEYYLTNDSKEATLTTTFTGTTALSETIFVFYPSKGYGSNLDNGAKTEIPAIQKPTATSFDGAADIMFAKPVTLDAEGKQLSDLEFARLGAIVKIVLKDNTGNLAGQHISALTMTAATNLTGRVYLDVVNQKLGELYYGQAKSVTAEYTDATQYEVNGTNATYVVIYPQTFKSGSKLSFEATTEGYAISKEITLAEDIVLESGKVTTLNVSLEAANVVKEESGLALPFKDDFARVAYDANENSITLSVLGENYSAMEKVYKAKVGNGGILKLGTSSAEGYFTTVALDLSKPFTVFVEAQRYGSSTSDKLQITVGSQVKTSANLTADSKYYVFEFEAASKKEQVEIRTIKRAYINDLQIVEGHGLDVPTLPAVLTVSTAEISGVSHEGEAKTFTYSVANPVEGVSATVTDNADWITTADNNGTVTVTVAANEVEEAREGVITVTYGDLTKTVTVKQNAKPAEGGGSTGGAWVRVTSTADILSGGKFIIGYEATANSGKLVPMRSDKCAATTSANGIFYSGTAVGTTTSNSSTIDMKTITATTAYEFTVTASTLVSGAINIQMADGKYLGSPNSKNTGKLYTSASKNTAYGMTMAANNVVTLKCAAASSYHTLQYNTSSPRFANYGGTQKNVVFYKWVE